MDLPLTVKINDHSVHYSLTEQFPQPEIKHEVKNSLFNAQTQFITKAKIKTIDNTMIYGHMEKIVLQLRSL